ncbi:PO113 protein, partial [Rhodinocichla rosea]|nr:PO113 protein [Rhodinocichla rosea]
TEHSWIALEKCSCRPLKDSLTVYTDAGKSTRRAMITWYQNDQWKHQILQTLPEDTLQTLELAAVCWTMSQWLSTPLNIVTDSLYVAGVAQRIEDAFIKDI